MKPDDYERNHALAAEYVVGTLQGAARQRFEHWMMTSSRLRRQVWYWERRLQPFNDSVPEVSPPDAVWQAIEQRLFPDTVQYSSPRWWQTIAAWRWSTAIAMLAVFALLVWTPPPTVVTHYVGVVQSQQAEPLWLVNASADHRLTVKAMPPVQPADGGNKDYQLWLLPESGAPVSLALLPTGGAQLQIDLSDQQVRQLLQSRSLAISLEPAGGSPTGQPTGPVVYQVRLVQM